MHNRKKHKSVINYNNYQYNGMRNRKNTDLFLITIINNTMECRLEKKHTTIRWNMTIRWNAEQKKTTNLFFIAINNTMKFRHFSYDIYIHVVIEGNDAKRD